MRGLAGGLGPSAMSATYRAVMIATADPTPSPTTTSLQWWLQSLTRDKPVNNANKTSIVCSNSFINNIFDHLIRRSAYIYWKLSNRWNDWLREILPPCTPCTQRTVMHGPRRTIGEHLGKFVSRTNQTSLARTLCSIPCRHLHWYSRNRWCIGLDWCTVNYDTESFHWTTLADNDR